MEFLAVFLLAAEAIKLENLKVLVNQYLTPLSSKLNPKITYVDDASHLGFWERNSVNFMFLGFYIFGFILILTLFHLYNFDPVEFFMGSEPIYWVLSIIGLLTIPLFVGFLPYQLVVWLVDLSVKGLTWVQLKTHTGVVGILGFLLFALQFIGRRIWLS